MTIVTARRLGRLRALKWIMLHAARGRDVAEKSLPAATNETLSVKLLLSHFFTAISISGLKNSFFYREHT